MEPFNICLAGHIIRIFPQYPYIKEYCRDYICEGDARVAISTDEEDLRSEMQHAAGQERFGVIPHQEFSAPYLETLAVYRKIADYLTDFDTLLFHGSAVAMDGEGYLFTAKSGTGKSTHTRLWRQVFKDRAVMVNDDKPLLRITDTGVWVCGTPWDGKHRLNSNISVPLKTICILTRGRENQISRITYQAALPMLIQQSYRPSDPKKLAKVLSLVDLVGKYIKLYRLECNMNPSAAETAYYGMTPSSALNQQSAVLQNRNQQKGT